MTLWTNISETVSQITPWIGPTIGVLITLYFLKIGNDSLRQSMKFDACAQPASAKVLSLYDLGNFSGDTTWVNLLIEIQCKDGSAPFVTTICEQGPVIRCHNVRVGRILQIRVLREMQNKVEVLWE